jgi:F420-0:gamma-glutamyl ligase
MEVTPIKTRTLSSPQDDLLEAIRASALAPRDGDCIAITSKVVSIWQGRCVPIDPTDTEQRDNLAKQEATLYVDRTHTRSTNLFTITNNTLINKAGIDASNSNGHYILLPEKPHEVAERLLAWCKETYNVATLYVVITDSVSVPLRRGVVGRAIAWAGFDPLVSHHYRDLCGKQYAGHTNLADALAAAAVLVMGETNACTPLALIRNAPHLSPETAHHEPPYEVSMQEDFFAPFLTRVPWKNGEGGL